MTKILFICHGNICRSAAAEQVMTALIREAGAGDRIRADSAAATDEELGHDVYPPMKRALLARGIPCGPHAARRTVRGDYGRYDLLIGMDRENLSDMRRIYGGDPEHKLSLLMEWAGLPGREVADPWYTRDFDGALSEIVTGCRGLIGQLMKKGYAQQSR